MEFLLTSRKLPSVAVEILGVLGRPSLHTSPWCAPFGASSFMLDLVVPRLWNSSSEKYSHLIKPWNTKYEGKTQLTRQSSFIRQWILVVRSICILIPCCARHAASSIAGDYQPLNIITYWYSLSPYNFPALYQLNIFLTRDPQALRVTRVSETTLTSRQGGCEIKKILVDPSLVIITLYIVFLICAWK